MLALYRLLASQEEIFSMVYYYYYYYHHHQQQQQPIPATVQSKARVCGPSLSGIADTNRAAAMDVCLL
jgi:hypothetical protein